MKEIRRGDVFIVDLDPVKGNEQGGIRPCVILQNDVGNRHSPTVILAPITSSLKKRDMPTHVILPQGNGFPTNSMVLLEHIRTIDRTRLSKYIKSLEPELMEKVDTALTISIGLSRPKYDELELYLCPACANKFSANAGFIVKRSNSRKNAEDTCLCCKENAGYSYRIIDKMKRYVSSI